MKIKYNFFKICINRWLVYNLFKIRLNKEKIRNNSIKVDCNFFSVANKD